MWSLVRKEHLKLNVFVYIPKRNVIRICWCNKNWDWLYIERQHVNIISVTYSQNALKSQSILYKQEKLIIDKIFARKWNKICHLYMLSQLEPILNFYASLYYWRKLLVGIWHTNVRASVVIWDGEGTCIYALFNRWLWIYKGLGHSISFWQIKLKGFFSIFRYDMCQTHCIRFLWRKIYALLQIGMYIYGIIHYNSVKPFHFQMLVCALLGIWERKSF